MSGLKQYISSALKAYLLAYLTFVYKVKTNNKSPNLLAKCNNKQREQLKQQLL